MPSAMRLRQPRSRFPRWSGSPPAQGDDMIVMNSSPLLSSVSIVSFVEGHAHALFLELADRRQVSTVLRAKRLTDLVMIRSIMPAMASSIMR